MAAPILIQNSTPGAVNLQIWRGDSWSLVINCNIAGTAINFTGWTAKMEIRNQLTNELVLTLTTPASGIAMTSGGAITLSITAAQCNALTQAVYVYDLQTTSTTGAVQTFIAGTLEIIEDNTAN
jgi:hypothetical protein